MKTTLRITSLMLAALLLAPTVATACPIDLRRIGPLTLRKGEVRRPAELVVDRAAWGLDDTWTATYPELNQQLMVRGTGLVEQASFPRQRIMSIDATAPDDMGWRYGDDDDPSTPPCAIAGQGDWQPPVIMVKETKQLVRIAAVVRPTQGDRAGCDLQTDDTRGCPVLTRKLVRLAAPVGTRTIRFELVR